MTGLAIDAISVVTGSARYDDGATVGPEDTRAGIVELIRRYRDAPAEHLAILAAGEPGVADLAGRALAGLPAGPAPDLLVLQQAGHDQHHFAVPLPRIVHEAPWPVAEDLAVSHGDDLGVFQLLRWALPAGRRAVVVISDRPQFGDRAVPPSGHVVALRLTRGHGPLRIIDIGHGAPPTADRILGGAGPCRSWVALHRHLGAQAPVAGVRFAVRVDPPHPVTDARAGWLLLEAEGVDLPLSPAADQAEDSP